MPAQSLAPTIRLGTARGLLPDLAAGGTAAALAGAVTVLAIVAALAIPAVSVGRGGGDLVAALDGGYRMMRGLVPHVDFAVPHGAWPLVEGWLALRLEPWAVPFVTYQVANWLTVLPGVLVLAARQRGPLAAAGVVAFAACATLLPFVVELEKASEFAYYAGYNRLTTALLFLVVVWAVRPARRGWGEAILVAYLLLALAATKVTGLMAGGAVVLASGMLSSPRRRVVVRAALVAALAVALLQAATGVPLAYLRDVLDMVAINRGGGGFLLGLTGLRALPACLVLALLAWALVRRRASLAAGLSRPLALARAERPAVLVTVVAATTLFAESQNNGSLGLAATAALLLMPLAGPAVPALRAALAVAVLAPWLGSAAIRGTTHLTGPFREARPDPAVERLLPGAVPTRQQAEMADDYRRLWHLGEQRIGGRASTLLAEAGKPLEAALFVAVARTVDEAARAALARGDVGPDSRVMTLNHIDWFARVLGARPVPGTNLWHDPARTFAPPVSGYRHYLRAADAVFHGLCATDVASDREFAPFLPALEADFARRPLTECWEVWLRRR